MARDRYEASFAQRKGEAGEEAARLQLRALGFELIRTGSNKWRVIGWRNRKGGGGIAEVIPEPRQRDEADWRAVEPGTGRSVFAEVKAREGRLRWSDVKEHQRSTLTRHMQAGGLSLLIWIDGADVHVMQWPVEGFAPRQSITPEQARAAAYTPRVTGKDDLYRALRTLQDEAERVYLIALNRGIDPGQEYRKLERAIIDAGKVTGHKSVIWERKEADDA